MTRKSFSKAGVTSRHIFWSHPKPWARTMARSPEPVTFTLCRCNTAISHLVPGHAGPVSAPATHAEPRNGYAAEFGSAQAHKQRFVRGAQSPGTRNVSFGSGAAVDVLDRGAAKLGHVIIGRVRPLRQ